MEKFFVGPLCINVERCVVYIMFYYFISPFHKFLGDELFPLRAFISFTFFHFLVGWNTNLSSCWSILLKLVFKFYKTQNVIIFLFSWISWTDYTINLILDQLRVLINYIQCVNMYFTFILNSVQSSNIRQTWNELC